MSKKTMKRYEETKNKGLEAIGDDQITEPVYDFTKTKVHIKAADPKDREDFDFMVSDHTHKSITKENNTSTKNGEAKRRATSDKEC
jgi:hypothetical protein